MNYSAYTKLTLVNFVRFRDGYRSLKTKFLFLLLAIYLGICGCDDAHVSHPMQIVEMVFPSQSAITAPPAEVWDAMAIQAEELMQWMKTFHSLDPADLASGTPESLEKIKRDIAYKLDGVPIEDYDLHAEYKVFYTKYIDAGGIAIVANADVEDKLLIEARNIVLAMTSKQPEVRDRLLSGHRTFYLILVGLDPETGILPRVPEFLTTWDNINTCGANFWQTPHVSGHCSATVGSDEYGYLRPFAHEFGHALEHELEYLNPGFQDRLDQAYAKAKESGAYRDIWDPYIISNPREYWAEGVEVWFYGIGPDREFETYEAFAEEDPLLYEIFSEWFYKASFTRVDDPSTSVIYIWD